MSGLRLAGLSFAGVVGGHLATYLLIAPDPHDREAMLAATGHGSWTLPIFFALATFLAVACGSAGARGRADTYFPLVARLGALQVGGFALLEISERAVANELTTSILSDPALLLGLAVQLLVAAVAPLLAWVVARSVERVRSLFGSRAARERSTHGHSALFTTDVLTSSWVLPRSPRAPPLPTIV